MKQRAAALLKELEALQAQVIEDGDKLYSTWQAGIVREPFRDSARNLAYYLALRRHDLRALQWEMVPLGLSSLGRLEARVLPTLSSVIASCARIAGADNLPAFPDEDEFERREKILEVNTADIFGPEPHDRYTRIMVTIPTQAVRDNKIIENLVERGMEIARINCSHDDEIAWQNMIEQVRTAAWAHNRHCLISMEIPGPKVRIDRVLSALPKARIFTGDRVFLTADRQMYLPLGIQVAFSCSVPEIVGHIAPGETVIIDDGHIEAVAEAVRDDGVILLIQRVINERGVLLRPEKGINFPGSDYRIPLLSKRDEEIMDFVCRQADMIGCSFVRDAADIDNLREAINKRQVTPNAKPVIIKVETLEAVRALPRILVAAASHFPTAVMIARGDLAVEAGYARLSEYQEEILWICEAAHIPAIWATQVVETLVKTGIPTRAEISDVTLAARSECVMLNKGPHINEGVSFVSDILSKFEKHVYKKSTMLRRLSIAGDQFEYMEKNL